MIFVFFCLTSLSMIFFHHKPNFSFPLFLVWWLSNCLFAVLPDSLIKLDLCPKQQEMLSHKARTFYKYWQGRFITSFPRQHRELLGRSRKESRWNCSSGRSADGRGAESVPGWGASMASCLGWRWAAWAVGILVQWVRKKLLVRRYTRPSGKTGTHQGVSAIWIQIGDFESLNPK